MDFGKNELERGLTILGRKLVSEKAPAIHLVVSGGAAMIARGIAERSTHDVDVMALRGIVDGELSPSWPLPQYFKDIVAEVGAEMNFGPSWVNAMTSLMTIQLADFPQRVWSDFETREYGPTLAVSYMGRKGLIQLKMWAAADRDAPRDLTDLEDLAPTRDEIEEAAAWLADEVFASEPLREKLDRLLEKLEYE